MRYLGETLGDDGKHLHFRVLRVVVELFPMVWHSTQRTTERTPRSQLPAPREAKAEEPAMALLSLFLLDCAKEPWRELSVGSRKK